MNRNEAQQEITILKRRLNLIGPKTRKFEKQVIESPTQTTSIILFLLLFLQYKLHKRC